LIEVKVVGAIVLRICSGIPTTTPRAEISVASEEDEMKRLMLTTTAILLCAVSAAHARDGYYEAAQAIFYDKNCTKLPADFLRAKIKGFVPMTGKTAEARKFGEEMFNDAQDSMQASFDDSKLSMKEFCAKEELDIKCSIFSFRHGDAPVDCRTMKILKPGQLPSHS
jgi:hypothetical protein